MNNATLKKPLTGKKVTVMFCCAFGTIITANMALVYSAVGSFPGLETRAPYVDSLTFETRRTAQEALGWDTNISYKAGNVFLSLKTLDGNVVVTPNVNATVGRATFDSADFALNLKFDGHAYSAPANLSPGHWQIKIQARSLEGVPFKRTLSFFVQDAS